VCAAAWHAAACLPVLLLLLRKLVLLLQTQLMWLVMLVPLLH
jgi:hypothetical protein